MFAPARRLQHLTLSTQHEHRYVCTHKGVSATRYTRGSLRFYAPIRGTVWSKRWSNKLRLIHRGILQRQSMLLTQHTQALLVPLPNVCPNTDKICLEGQEEPVWHQWMVRQAAKR